MKEDSFGYDTFLSPFTWRYGSKEMRNLFSEQERRSTWRRIWLELARAEAEFGLALQGGARGHKHPRPGEKDVDIAKAHELERKIRHDLMAELSTFADQAGKGGGKLHLGATSMDIEDNADALIFRNALGLILTRLVNCLEAAKEKIVKYERTVCMAWTHLQPAEPTTLGYRFANYAQDLLIDIELLETVRDQLPEGQGDEGGGRDLGELREAARQRGDAEELERKVMEALGLDYFAVSTQTYPRKVDYILLSCLGSIAASCHKFGLDLRVLQSPTFGELSEPMEEFQVGRARCRSRRTRSAQRGCARSPGWSPAFPRVAFANAANSILERTLDDSANRRVAIPEAFLALDECLMIYERLMRGLKVYPAMIEKNLEKFGPFAGTEAVMMKLVEKGGDRQQVHELIRVDSFKAWDEVMNGQPEPARRDARRRTQRISSKLGPSEISRLLDPRHHTGDAERKVRTLVRDSVNPVLKRYREKRRDLGRGRVLSPSAARSPTQTPPTLRHSRLSLRQGSRSFRRSWRQASASPGGTHDAEPDAHVERPQHVRVREPSFGLDHAEDWRGRGEFREKPRSRLPTSLASFLNEPPGDVAHARGPPASSGPRERA